MPGVAFSFRLDPQVKAALDSQAKLENRSTAYVLQQAASDYLARQKHLRDQVLKLDGEAERGQFISEEAMTGWFLSLGTNSELQEPEPDVFSHGS